MAARRLTLICLVLSVASCTGSDRSRDSGAGQATPPPDTIGKRVVTPYGMPPLRAGMTIAEARAALPSLEIPDEAEKGSCVYGKSRELPDINVMFENARLARVDVLGGPTRTVEGAGIPDDELRIRALYPGRVRVAKHKYLDAGHYLTIRPTNPRDSVFAIVFETDGKSVRVYRAGRDPQVHYVEGCA